MQCCGPTAAYTELRQAIDPNLAVEFKESDKVMMQNTEKPLLNKQAALSEKRHKKNDKNY